MSSISIRSSRSRRHIMPKLKTPAFSSEDDEEDNDDRNNELECNDCGREFGTQVGLSVHQSRWCNGSSGSKAKEDAEDENEEEEEEEEEEEDDEEEEDEEEDDEDGTTSSSSSSDNSRGVSMDETQVMRRKRSVMCEKPSTSAMVMA